MTLLPPLRFINQGSYCNLISARGLSTRTVGNSDTCDEGRFNETWFSLRVVLNEEGRVSQLVSEPPRERARCGTACGGTRNPDVAIPTMSGV